MKKKGLPVTLSTDAHKPEEEIDGYLMVVNAGNA